MVRTPNYYPLHKLQGTVQFFDSRNFDRRSKIMNKNSVSTAVSNAEKSEPPMANLSEIRLLRFGEIWTIESDGELGKWA